MLRWAPRIIGILSVLLLSLFALDVFAEDYGLARTVLALVIHLVPALIVLAVLLVAWRWPRAGGFLFLALAAWYVAMTGGDASLAAYLAIAGPLVVAGALFLADGFACAGGKG